METLTIRPYRYEQVGSIVWQNPNNAYDGNIDTWATISSNKNTCANTEIYFLFDYSSIPSNAIISKVVYSIYGRGNTNPIFGSNQIVINCGIGNTQYGNTSNAWYNKDITSQYNGNNKVIVKQSITQTLGATTCEFYINDMKMEITYELSEVTSVTLDKTSLTLFPGDLGILNATVNVIGNILDLFVTWQSENENVAIVKTYSGNQATIKPTGFGETNIIATSIFDNQKKAKTLISVPDNSFSKLYCGENKVKEIKINDKKVLQVYLGEVQVFMSTEEFQTMIMNQDFE